MDGNDKGVLIDYYYYYYYNWLLGKILNDQLTEVIVAANLAENQAFMDQ